MHKGADSMHKEADSMHKEADSMHKEADSMHKGAASMHKGAASMHKGAASMHKESRQHADVSLHLACEWPLLADVSGFRSMSYVAAWFLAWADTAGGPIAELRHSFERWPTKRS